MRNHIAVSTSLDAERRTVRSGATATVVEIPADVTFAALLAQRCAGRAVGSTIDFFPSGASCGGAIAISRQGFGYQNPRQLADRRRRSCRDRQILNRGGTAGFTLIETLAALGVMAAGLAAIGALAKFEFARRPLYRAASCGD